MSTEQDEHERATAALHDALDAVPYSVHGREHDWVDATGEVIAGALLAAGWTPPPGRAVEPAPALRAVALDPDDPQQMRALHDALVRAPGVMGPERLADALRALRDGSAR